LDSYQSLTPTKKLFDYTIISKKVKVKIAIAWTEPKYRQGFRNLRSFSKKNRQGFRNLGGFSQKSAPYHAIAWTEPKYLQSLETLKVS